MAYSYYGNTKALTLEAIPHTEGRVYNTNVTSASTSLSLRYEYTIKDHLGNARLAFTDKNANVPRPDCVFDGVKLPSLPLY